MSKVNEKLWNDDLKGDYLFECAVCGREQRAIVSIFMHMGINSGHVNCLQCESFLHLEVAGDVMVSRRWDDWLQDHGDFAH